MCPHCRRTYARPRDLEKHVKRAIHCWCGYFAVNQNAWERHVQQRHTGGAQQQKPAPAHAGPVVVSQEPQAAHHVEERFGGAQQQPPPWADPVDVTQEPQASGSAPGVWWF